MFSYSNTKFWQRNDLILELSRKGKQKEYQEFRSSILTELGRDVWEEVISDFSLIDQCEPFFDVRDGVVVAGIGSQDMSHLQSLLKKLIPWRKGPWEYCGISVDAEWRSDIKYGELHPILPLLNNKVIVDLGGGNGYYGFRLINDGASTVLNLDPSEKFFYQFELAQKFIQRPNIQIEPIGFQDVNRLGLEVDAVLCMGVLYHQKDPLQVLESVKSLLKPGGIAVIESMIIPGDGDYCLFPEDRYAKARNVYFLPTRDTLVNFCKRAGFVDTEVISDRTTEISEQRKTEWMQFESLEDFLMPGDLTRTIENYPAPRRAIVVCRKKEVKKKKKSK